MTNSKIESEFIGNVELFHSFEGTFPVRKNWMICNGSVVNKVNYEMIHGEHSSIRDQLGLSPLLGIQLPKIKHDKFIYIIKVK